MLSTNDHCYIDLADDNRQQNNGDFLHSHNLQSIHSQRLEDRVDWIDLIIGTDQIELRFVDRLETIMIQNPVISNKQNKEHSIELNQKKYVFEHTRMEDGVLLRKC